MLVLDPVNDLGQVITESSQRLDRHGHNCGALQTAQRSVVRPTPVMMAICLEGDRLHLGEKVDGERRVHRVYALPKSARARRHRRGRHGPTSYSSWLFAEQSSERGLLVPNGKKMNSWTTDW